MNPPFWLMLIVVIGIVAAAAFAVLSDRPDRDRQRVLERLAVELHLSFDPRDRTDFPPHETLLRGRKRRRCNTLSGTLELGGHEMAVEAGDFVYTTGGRGASAVMKSYAIIDIPHVGTPALAVRREEGVDKLAGTVGFDDIDFESEEFSRGFWVASSDKRFAYEIVHPRMIEFFMMRTPPTIDLREDRLCLTAGRERWSPQEFSQWLAWGGSFLELWPEHVLERYPGRTRT